MKTYIVVVPAFEQVKVKGLVEIDAESEDEAVKEALLQVQSGSLQPYDFVDHIHLVEPSYSLNTYEYEVREGNDA
jgi:hypothetical protein